MTGGSPSSATQDGGAAALHMPRCPVILEWSAAQ